MYRGYVCLGIGLARLVSPVGGGAHLDAVLGTALGSRYPERVDLRPPAIDRFASTYREIPVQGFHGLALPEHRPSLVAVLILYHLVEGVPLRIGVLHEIEGTFVRPDLRGIVGLLVWGRGQLSYELLTLNELIHLMSA